MYLKRSLAIIVPAYNEAKLISKTLADMPAEADRIYVVDDASTDATRQIAESLQDGRICVLSSSHNRGVGASIVNGYKQALEDGFNIMVVMAGDGQMSAKYLPDLLGPIISGKADYSKGNRFLYPGHTKGMSNWRFFGNRVLTYLTKIASGYWEIGDPQNGYAAATRECLLKINLDKIYPRYGYCNDLLVKLKVAGCRVSDVPIPALYGPEKSKIRYH
ncbi:MAG: glycosyltransferase family 2 protein, partial [Chloroflexi bacterium]|nr:glycosyltransferase family 2 protein [Chloroflexota bacterium]